MFSSKIPDILTVFYKIGVIAQSRLFDIDSSIKKIMQLFGNIKHIDLSLLSGCLRKNALSGVLSVQGDYNLEKWFFHKGRCLLCLPSGWDEYVTGVFVELLTDEEKLRQDLCNFIREHPSFILEAVKSVDISLEVVSSQFIHVSRECMYRSLFRNDAEFIFEKLPLNSVIPDQQLIELLIKKTEKESLFDQSFLSDFGMSIRKVPLLAQERSDRSLSKRTVAVLQAIDEQKTVLDVITELKVYAVYEILDEFEYLENKGMISYKPFYQHDYAPYSGYERLISSIIEIYKGIITVLFPQAMNDFDSTKNAILKQGLADALGFYPILFHRLEKFTTFTDCIDQLIDLLKRIEPQDKISILKKTLNTLLITLICHVRGSHSFADSDRKLQKMRGFLSFIKKTGNFTQRELADMISSVIDLADAIPFQDRVDEGGVQSQYDALLAESNYVALYEKLVKNSDPVIVNLSSEQRNDLMQKTLSFFIEHIGNTTTKLVLSEKSLVTTSMGDLDSDDAYILSRLDCPASIQEIHAISGISVNELYYRLYCMMVNKYVEVFDPEKVRSKMMNGKNQKNCQGVIEENPVEEHGPNDEAGSALLAQLKLELKEIRSLEPHQIFGLNPHSTEVDLDDSVHAIKERYNTKNFSREELNFVGATLASINECLDDAAALLKEMLHSLVRKELPVEQVEIVKLPPCEKLDDVSEREARVNSPENETSVVVEEVVFEVDEYYESPQVCKNGRDNWSANYSHGSGSASKKKNISRQEERKKQRQVDSMKMYKKALDAQNEKNFEEAIELLNQAIKLTPHNFSLHRTLECVIVESEMHEAENLRDEAQEHAKNGNLKKALNLMKEVIKLNKTQPLYYFELAQLLDLQGKKHDEAEYFYRRAIEMEPGNPDFHLHLGKSFRNRGKIKEAREQFMEGLRWSKNNKAIRKELNLLP